MQVAQVVDMVDTPPDYEVDNRCDDIPHSQKRAAREDDEAMSIAKSFEDELGRALQEEKVQYVLDMGRNTRRVACLCMLCPFRSFGRREHLMTHLAHHEAPHYIASKTCDAQYNLAKSLYRFDRVAGICRGGDPRSGSYLARSAKQIRQWNSTVSANILKSASRSNETYLVFESQRLARSIGSATRLQSAHALTRNCIERTVLRI